MQYDVRYTQRQIERNTAEILTKIINLICFLQIRIRISVLR